MCVLVRVISIGCASVGFLVALIIDIDEAADANRETRFK